ncbi:glycosyltransferase family 2 protein [bacterium M00.F.Ca.ET.228.01.1.1]|uniref:glycosyltransferase family 2 protein n=1 Tax=Paraburkholderia phenoliruptrix TaxID=252970 RepID=UPI001091BC0C|nr:glycosyltransferase family 2 protein [Paraburkholderia phenoliruptrix]TGP43142.1 glycosyltransferase family 2 protein [bacterium M00.F.Ca.ET.228.01.1.1]TGS00580.1 glycosyltransferase family 2 protein [bacterium M00.F.Ca.ET.191.01.1.1]TGU04966.1 glycosyltransferase family 2 protein [bacterium M00.F.Ca.ET.155.01.1.1]MBW0446926.1 glycosyltransferase family 2 protein [Paraburkholderia phenoliruptrix]MBW9099422.1 glycosyltransferase family 2 protein [Paraburkholderia phenoliruptrix]
MKATQAPRSGREGLSVSVVVYRPDLQLLMSTLAGLAAASQRLRAGRPGLPVTLYLVDNGGLPDTRAAAAELEQHGVATTIIAGHGNVGYGRGHNLAIERTDSRYHLILNPDIDLAPDALCKALDFFDAHTEAGLITPWIGDEHGHQLFLCRRYPALLDLFARGFLPASLRQWFSRRLARYEMRDRINARDVVWDPPIVSGCFMMFRTDVLKQLAGFDARYFLYFEDYDLSLRAHELTRVVYTPSVRVVHHGGGAARKGYAHIRMFVASAYKFYNRFGWKWL